MRFLRFAAISAAFVIFASSSAFAQMAPAKTADTSKGKTLVDNKGMTPNVFDKMQAGMDVQWPVRGELAGVDGERGRESLRGMDSSCPR